MRSKLLMGVLWLMVSMAGAADRDEQRLLVLGDSLSAAHNMPIEQGWVQLIANRLAREYPAVRVINASVSGETSAGGAERIDQLLSTHAPSLVLLELGANDGLRGLPVDQTRAQLKRIIDTARNAGARVLLIGTELPPNYGQPYLERFRAMYRGLAEEYKLPLIPFLLEGVALTPELMQEDGLHPTAQAQPAIADRVWTTLLPALQRTHSIRSD